MDRDHLTQDQIGRFALPTDTLSPERVHANEHIQSCVQCREAFQQALRPFAFDFLNGPEQITEECLDNDLIIRYVQGTADAVERDIVEMHEETCALCRADIAKLTTAYKAMEEADAGIIDKENILAILRSRLLAWLKVPSFRSGIRIGGAALAGAAAMLLLLLPSLRHNSQEELAQQAQRERDVAVQQAQQAQRDRDQAQRDKADAERKAVAAADAAKKAAEIASAEALPEVSVTVRFQKPDSSDSGYEAIIRNPFRDPVPVSFVVARPSSGSSKNYNETVLDSLQTTRIGESNGWAFVSGDTLVISQPGHKSSKWVVP